MFSSPQLQAVASSLAHNDPLRAVVHTMRKRPDNVLGLLLRPLSREEIAIMEGRGCRADDWSLIQVAEDFDPFRVRRTHLVGHCVLGRFRDDCEVRPGITLPSGIYDSTLIDAQVGNNCLLENVRFCARTVVDHGAVVFDVGSLIAGEKVHFGSQQTLAVGPETGGRPLPVWPGLDVAAAAAIATQLADYEGQKAIVEAHQRYVEDVTCSSCWVGRGAIIRHTTRIADAMIGPGCIIDQATDLADVAICCSQDEPTHINAAAVTQSLLGPGVTVAGGAIVRHSVLVEHCSVDLNAVVEHSVIGCNTSIAKGEVTASIVGPFVGLHHQSLLIGAIWPQGKGNIAYGAMVGSNHTGRAPDQEIWPGEGTFFGLGCNIKLPSDFSQSPYLMIGSGVATLAQRVCYPFSLIATPIQALSEEAEVPRAYNELIPAWGLYANAYAIVRAEEKYRLRDRSGRGHIPFQVLRPEIIALVRDARSRLMIAPISGDQAPDLGTIYQEQAIAGVGKNFLREKQRRLGVEAYGTVLQRYALRVLLAAAEGHEQLPGSVDLAHELADELLPGLSLEQRLSALLEIERENVEIVKRAKIADDRRGVAIIPGYADCHPSVEDDRVVRAAYDRLARTRERVQAQGYSELAPGIADLPIGQQKRPE